MKKQNQVIAMILGFLAFGTIVLGEEPTDEIVWEFGLFLYGFDEEETARLQGLDEEARIEFIQLLREMDEIVGAENDSFRLKSPKEFTKEEREFYEMMKTSFRWAKTESKAAIERAENLTEEDLERIVVLAEELWKRNEAGELPPYSSLYSGQNQIPEDWGFVDPVRIDILEGSISVLLYRNALANNGPQVIFTVTRLDDSNLRKLHYSDNLGSEKEWTIELPTSSGRECPLSRPSPAL